MTERNMIKEMSLLEIEGEIRSVLSVHGVRFSAFDPVVAPNLRLDLGDFATDAPLRLLKAGFKGERFERIVTELIGRLEGVGCEVLQFGEAGAKASDGGGDGGGDGSYGAGPQRVRGGYLNFKVPVLSGRSVYSPERGVAATGKGCVFKVVVVAPTAGLEGRGGAGQQQVLGAEEAGVEGETNCTRANLQARGAANSQGGSLVGCHGAAYLRSVARGLAHALMIREQFPEAKLEIILGKQGGDGAEVDGSGLDTKCAGKILLEMARNAGQQLDGVSQERALALLRSHLAEAVKGDALEGTTTQTHVWLSANSFLPDIFKQFFGEFGKRAKFHFSAASWDEGVPAIPSELMEGADGQSSQGMGLSADLGAGLGAGLADAGIDEAALGVGLLWCLAGERGGAEFDWYAGALAEWDNLVWATRVLERRLERHLGVQEACAEKERGVEEMSFTLPIQGELRGVMLRSLTLPMWLERVAMIGDVESFMVVWRDWLNKSNRFLNQPATGMLPKEWREIIPSLKAGLSVTMRLI